MSRAIMAGHRAALHARAHARAVSHAAQIASGEVPYLFTETGRPVLGVVPLEDLYRECSTVKYISGDGSQTRSDRHIRHADLLLYNLKKGDVDGARWAIKNTGVTAESRMSLLGLYPLQRLYDLDRIFEGSYNARDQYIFRLKNVRTLNDLVRLTQLAKYDVSLSFEELADYLFHAYCKVATDPTMSDCVEIMLVYLQESLPDGVEVDFQKRLEDYQKMSILRERFGDFHIVQSSSAMDFFKRNIPEGMNEYDFLYLGNQIAASFAVMPFSESRYRELQEMGLDVLGDMWNPSSRVSSAFLGGVDVPFSEKRDRIRFVEDSGIITASQKNELLFHVLRGEGWQANYRALCKEGADPTLVPYYDHWIEPEGDGSYACLPAREIVERKKGGVGYGGSSQLERNVVFNEAGLKQICNRAVRSGDELERQ